MRTRSQDSKKGGTSKAKRPTPPTTIERKKKKAHKPSRNEQDLKRENAALKARLAKLQQAQQDYDENQGQAMPLIEDYLHAADASALLSDGMVPESHAMLVTQLAVMEMSRSHLREELREAHETAILEKSRNLLKLPKKK